MRSSSEWLSYICTMFSRFKAGCNIAFRPNSEASFLCGYETFACCLINMVITCKWAHYHTCWNNVVVNFPTLHFQTNLCIRLCTNSANFLHRKTIHFLKLNGCTEGWNDQIQLGSHITVSLCIKNEQRISNRRGTFANMKNVVKKNLFNWMKKRILKCKEENNVVLICILSKKTVRYTLKRIR